MLPGLSTGSKLVGQARDFPGQMNSRGQEDCPGWVVTRKRILGRGKMSVER